MRSRNALCIIFLSSILVISIACGKSQAIALLSTRFTWTYQGSTYTASQYSASQYSRGPYLITGAQGNTLTSFPRCDLNLNSFVKGTYTINSSGINILKYVDNAGNVFEASTGEVNITAYGGDVISGNFS